MLGLRDVAATNLRALRFRDEATFREAARIAAANKIAVDAPGRDTLIIAHEHESLFAGLAYQIDRIATKAEDRDRAALRRRVF